MPSTFTFEEAIEAQPKTFSVEDVSKDVPRRYFTDISGKRAVLSPTEAQAWRKQQPVTTAKSYTAPGLEFAQKSPVYITPDIPKEAKDVPRRYFTDISGKRAVLSPPEAQAWRKQQPVTTAKSYTAPGLEFAQKSPVDITPDIPKEALQGLPGWGKAALGAGQEAASFTGSMSAPLNLALLAAGPLTRAYSPVSKALSAFFAGSMGKQAAEEVGTLLNLPKEERNPMDVTKHVTRMILSGGFAAALAHDVLAKAEVKLRENPKPPTGETPDAITQVQQPRSVSTQRPRDDEGGTPPGREPGGGVPGATTSETPGKPTETAPKEEAQGKPIAPAISMGGRNPDDPKEISPSNLALLGSSIKTMAEQGGKPKISKAYELGDWFAQVKDGIHNTLEGLRAAGSYMKKRLEGFPEVTKFTSLLGDRHLALSESALNASRFMRDAMKGIPDKITREAISNWVDAGGDTEKLQEGLEKTKPQYKAGYRKALNLTPEEQVIAKNIQNYFEARLNDAIEAGILEDGVENYIHRYFEKDTPWKQRILSELRSGIFTGQPALAKQRVFSYDFEAEEAGYRPVKDFAKRVIAYDLALNKAIADRELVKGLMQLKTASGDPWISVGGVANKIGGEGTDSALLVKPSVKPKNVAEYKSFDHPALRKWKWVAEDENGRPVLVQGSVLIHPDALPKVRALFEGSRIRANPIGRTFLNVGSTVKQTMLDLSLFHQVQIGVHAAEHQRFQSRLGNMPEIDLTDPDQRGLVKGGMVIGETTGREHFDEGSQGSSLTKHLPFGVGESFQNHKEWLFGVFIPKIKMITGLMALARNRELFPKLTPDEVYHMTADQMNAAFGELNYAMLGRSATMQDALRLTLLSPDFTEARARFIAQGATKYGGRPFFDEGKLKIGEQGKALLFGASALYLTSRIINKLVSGEYHFEPKNAFNVLYNGKAYSLRTVQGDVLKLATEPAQFIRNRLNPVYGRTVLEAATGRDYFGRKRSFEQQTEDLAKTAIPISVRGLFSGREQSLAESLMNSMGVTEHRDSPMQRIYELAEKWKERNKVFGEPGEFIYDPDKDKYRGVKLAARYSDLPAIRSEILMAEQKGATKSQIVKDSELSSKHMFTGSTKANEKKFKESLSKDQLKQYDDAVKERNDIAKKIKEAIR